MLCIVYRASKRVLQSGQELTKPIHPTPSDAENTPRVVRTLGCCFLGVFTEVWLNTLQSELGVRADPSR